MKVVVVLSFLVILAAIAAVDAASNVPVQTCGAYHCLAAGNHCDPHNQEFAVCPEGYYCNGRCEPHVRVGGACTALECVPNAWCNTTKGICIEIEYQQEGQACYANEFCIGDLQCVNSVCQRLPRLGQDCSADFTCTGSSLCNAVTKTCTSFFSVSEGGKCTDSRECTAGDFCSVMGICTAGFKSSLKACNSSSQCDPNENCQCPSPQLTEQPLACSAPQVFTKEQAGVIVDYYDCIEKHNCFFWDTSCTKCKKSFCNYYSKYESVVFTVPTALQSCLGDPAVETMCSEEEPYEIGMWGVVIIVAGVVVVVTLIIAGAIGVAVLLKNRKHSRPSGRGYSRLVNQ